MQSLIARGGMVALVMLVILATTTTAQDEKPKVQQVTVRFGGVKNIQSESKKAIRTVYVIGKEKSADNLKTDDTVTQVYTSVDGEPKEHTCRPSTCRAR